MKTNTRATLTASLLSRAILAYNIPASHDKALKQVVTDVVMDYAELFKQFMDNPDLKQSLNDPVFALTYKTPGTQTSAQFAQRGR